MRSRSWIGILLAFAMAGCTDSSQPVSSNAQGSLTSAGSAGNEILHTVTGTVEWRGIQPATGPDMGLKFTARQYADGTIDGDFECLNNCLEMKGRGKIYDMKVSGNTAKIGLNFTCGNEGTFCNCSRDITKMSGWVVVIDNGDGAGATGPSYVSMSLFTDGSDIGDGTIEGLDRMEPQQFLEWMRTYLLPLYGVAYADYLLPCAIGSVHVE